MAGEIRSFDLMNNTLKIPSVDLGTWQSEPGLVGQAVSVAVKVVLGLISNSICVKLSFNRNCVIHVRMANGLLDFYSCGYYFCVLYLKAKV